jgi:flagellar biosynthesis/type III secretory pathway protein FliH
LSSERYRVRLERSPTAARLLATGAEAVLTERLARARAEGHAQGLEEGRRGCAEVLDAAVERLSALEAEQHEAVTRTAIEVALEITRVLLRREIGAGNYDMEQIVRSALAEAATGRAPCRVHVNPIDHATLSGVRFRSGTEIAADSGVPRGDVHVETQQGLLVRDSDMALRAIRRRLWGEDS